MLTRLLLAPFTVVNVVVFGAALIVKVVALIDALIRPQLAFRSAGKQSKVFWVAVLALAVVFYYGLGLLGLAGLVAAIVYLVDVRPRLRELRRGSRW